MIVVDECCVRCGQPALSASTRDLRTDETVFARKCGCSAEPREVRVPWKRWVETEQPSAIMREVEVALGPVMLAPRVIDDGRVE